MSINQSINPILIRVYLRKPGWPDLSNSNSNFSNSHSPSRSIHGILLLQTNTLALLLHLRLPRLFCSSSLLLVLHLKLQRFSQNMPIIPPQHVPVPSHSIRLCHLFYIGIQFKIFFYTLFLLLEIQTRLFSVPPRIFHQSGGSLIFMNIY